jgi:uncharacterized protein
MRRERPLAFHIVDLPPEGVDVRGEVPSAELDIVADEVQSFPSALQYELNLAPVQDGVLVRGRLAGVVVRVCDRCLAAGQVEVAVPDVCHHFEHVVGTVVDLTEVLREDILLSFPQAWLCRADCRGLCPRCGCDLNREECRCGGGEAGTAGEAPWGVLDDLLRREGR